MSCEAARAFTERMKSDPAFRDKVLAVADPDERLALVHAEGFDCSAEEIGRQAEALADQHLDAVVGGFDAPPKLWCDAVCLTQGAWPGSG